MALFRGLRVKAEDRSWLESEFSRLAAHFLGDVERDSPETAGGHPGAPKSRSAAERFRGDAIP